ncbi:PR-1-like protein [Wilcoxina mikolae CBS 423.85]|nr:PR-1-like protein [Wilcoxina mikolae CBS 423.85]
MFFLSLPFFLVAADSTLCPDFNEVMLRDHNLLRAQHHVPPLIWDTALEDSARAHAQKCDFVHSGGPYGENLAANLHCEKDVCPRWGSEERKHYNFDAPGFSPATGHFTQMVWKDTQKLGCAEVHCPGEIARAGAGSGRNVVCHYWPHGNKGGPDKYALNVPRP